MSYSPNTWHTGDTITHDALNNLESGLQAAAATADAGLSAATSAQQASQSAQTTATQASSDAAGALSAAQAKADVSYVDTSVAGVGVATATANTVARRDGSANLSAAGVLLGAQNASANAAARKDYVDGLVGPNTAAIAAMPTSYAYIPPGTTITVVKDGTTGWPVRPTARADVVVAWKGQDPSPSIVASGTAGMLNNVDIRFVTP